MSLPNAGHPPLWFNYTGTMFGLNANERIFNIRSIILSESFFQPWTAFRDQLPLIPGKEPMKLNTTGINNPEFVKAVEHIYESMEVIHTCKYDRPSEADMRQWTPQDHVCHLVYQAARNLARPGEILFETFQRKNLANKPGRNQAKCRIAGLFRVIEYLAMDYTQFQPTSIVYEIEAKLPSANPGHSPIPLVRRKYELKQMDINELRRKMLDEQRQGQDEKEWLVRKLVEKEARMSTGVQQNTMATATGAKRKREGDDVVGVAQKRVNGAQAEPQKTVRLVVNRNAPGQAAAQKPKGG